MEISAEFRRALETEVRRLTEQKSIVPDMQAVLGDLEAVERRLTGVLNQAKANKTPAQYQLKDALKRVQNAIYQMDTALKVEKKETSRIRTADWPK